MAPSHGSRRSRTLVGTSLSKSPSLLRRLSLLIFAAGALALVAVLVVTLASRVPGSATAYFLIGLPFSVAGFLVWNRATSLEEAIRRDEEDTADNASMVP